jgi:hypothetical protein
MRIDNKRISETMPVKVCYEIDSNRFRTKQLMEINKLSDEYFVEKKSFNFQENNFAKALSLLSKFNNSQIVVDKRKHQLLLETLLTIKRRNPDSRRRIIQAFKESYLTNDGINSFFQYFLEEFGIQKVTPEIEVYIKKFLSSESQNPNRLHDMYLSAFINKVDYTTITEMTRLFYSLKQYILHAPIGQQFITSDNPGFTVAGNTAFSLGGFGDQFEFYFPLSPSLCLYLKSNDIENSTFIEKMIYPIIVTKSEVEQINKVTKSLCIKCIFAYYKKTLENI